MTVFTYVSYVFSYVSLFLSYIFVLPSDFYKANLWLPRAILNLGHHKAMVGPKYCRSSHYRHLRS